MWIIDRNAVQVDCNLCVQMTGENVSSEEELFVYSGDKTHDTGVKYKNNCAFIVTLNLMGLFHFKSAVF